MNEIYIWEKIRQGDEIFYVVQEDDPEIIRLILKHSFNYHITPVITVENGNMNDRGWLHLKHHYDGKELDPIHRDGTLKNIYYLWGRRVLLETKLNGKTAMVSFNGNNINIDKRKR